MVTEVTPADPVRTPDFIPACGRSRRLRTHFPILSTWSRRWKRRWSHRPPPRRRCTWSHRWNRSWSRPPSHRRRRWYRRLRTKVPIQSTWSRGRRNPWWKSRWSYRPSRRRQPLDVPPFCSTRPAWNVRTTEDRFASASVAKLQISYFTLSVHRTWPLNNDCSVFRLITFWKLNNKVSLF